MIRLSGLIDKCFAEINLSDFLLSNCLYIQQLHSISRFHSIVRDFKKRARREIKQNKIEDEPERIIMGNIPKRNVRNQNRH